MRVRALETPAALVGGIFREKMRIAAAARVLATARRIALLAEGGLPQGFAPAGSILALALRWDAAAMTADEFAETLEAAEVVAVLAEGARLGGGRPGRAKPRAGGLLPSMRPSQGRLG